MSTLYIDVGNTHTVFGVKIDGSFKKWRLSTARYETEDEIFSHVKTLFDFQGVKFESINSVVVTSVVPSLDHVFERFATKFLGVDPLWVVADDRCGVDWPVENPKEIGADRVANVIGGVHEYSRDVLIVDFGTAITIDVVKEGRFLGGVISPGINTMLYSLFSGTAKLPLIDLKVPKTAVGRNTEDNIRIGILKGTAHAVNGLLREISDELDTDFVVVVTGGQSKLLVDLLIHDHHDPDLTLKGMEWYRRLHENTAG